MTGLEEKGEHLCRYHCMTCSQSTIWCRTRPHLSSVLVSDGWWDGEAGYGWRCCRCTGRVRVWMSKSAAERYEDPLSAETPEQRTARLEKKRAYRRVNYKRKRASLKARGET